MEKLDEAKKRYPEKFVPENVVFGHIHQGDRIFVGTGCGEPQYLVRALMAVRDDYQNKGIGAELLSTLTYLAKRQGLLGFYAEVLAENRAMLHLFDKMGFDIKKRREEGLYELEMTFK